MNPAIDMVERIARLLDADGSNRWRDGLALVATRIREDDPAEAVRVLTSMGGAGGFWDATLRNPDAMRELDALRTSLWTSLRT